MTYSILNIFDEIQKNIMLILKPLNKKVKSQVEKQFFFQNIYVIFVGVEKMLKKN